MQDITDRYVVCRPVEGDGPEVVDNVWHCLGGFGCKPDTNGRMVFAENVATGEQADIRSVIERFADDDEVIAARRKRGDRNEGVS